MTQPSATRGAFLQNEAGQAGVGGLPGSPGSWQSRAGATFASKEALIVNVSSDKGQQEGASPPWGRGQAPPCPGGPLPPWGGGPGQLWALGRGLLASRDGPETAQTAALTQGACPEARAPPLGGPPPETGPLWGQRLYGSSASGSSPSKRQGEASLGGRGVLPGHPVYLGMTRGALPLSPQDKHPLDLVRGPWCSCCRWALNTEPGLLAACPPRAGGAQPAALPSGLGLTLPLPSPRGFFFFFFPSFSSIKWRQKG